jgi:hypothetical protein
MFNSIHNRFLSPILALIAVTLMVASFAPYSTLVKAQTSIADRATGLGGSGDNWRKQVIVNLDPNTDAQKC